MRLPIDDLQQTTVRLRESGGDALAGRSVLLTGGTGFVGRWLVETFCALNKSEKLGARMVIVSRSPERFRAAAPHLANDSAITMIEGDVHAAPPCDLVIHGATPSSHSLAGEHPRLILEAIEGTRHALEYAVGSGARRFLYLSSGAMYGRQPADLAHIPEDFRSAPDVLDPRAAYAETKRAGELLCAAYAQRFGLEITVARGFSFIGPFLPLGPKFAAGEFLAAALAGNAIAVRRDGTAIRSYLDAADLAVWLWVIHLRGAAGCAYNVGSENAVTIAELAREIARLHDPPVAVAIRETADPVKPADRYLPSTRRARTELGLAETTDWRTALRKTYDWYRAQRLAEVAT